MSESEAADVFKRIRFADNNGEPYCPTCASTALYTYRNRPLWRCKRCDRQFSVTSDTIFAHHKLPLKKYLLAIAAFVNGTMGVAALRMCRELRVSYKCAFIMMHKIREVVGEETRGHMLGGEVEVDGVYVGGYVKPKNVRSDREDRRRMTNGKRRSVIGMRERGSNGRVITSVFKDEASGVDFIVNHMRPGTMVYADETPAFDRIYDRFPDMARITHKIRYAEGQTSTNQIESFFSRIRAGEWGVYRHLSGNPDAPHLLEAYAAEMAWRENNRRVGNRELYEATIRAAMTYGPSMYWKGYWQRRKIVLPGTANPTKNERHKRARGRAQRAS